MKTDGLIDKFFTLLNGWSPPVPIPLGVLRFILAQLTELTESPELPNLTDDERTELRGKRAAWLACQLILIAEGLRSCPEVAADLGTGPENFERTANQLMSQGGQILIMENIYRSADSGMLQEVAAARDLLHEADQAVTRAAASPRTTPGLRALLKVCFGDLLAILKIRKPAQPGQPDRTQPPQPAMERPPLLPRHPGPPPPPDQHAGLIADLVAQAQVELADMTKPMRPRRKE